jgi:hypothetical protein
MEMVNSYTSTSYHCVIKNPITNRSTYPPSVCCLCPSIPPREVLKGEEPMIMKESDLRSEMVGKISSDNLAAISI